MHFTRKIANKKSPLRIYTIVGISHIFHRIQSDWAIQYANIEAISFQFVLGCKMPKIDFTFDIYVFKRQHLSTSANIR